MITQDNYFDKLRNFGALLHSNFDLDFNKSGDALEKVNEFLHQNPELLKKIIQPENLAVYVEIQAIFEGKGGEMKKIMKALPLLKKLKFK